jgi:hypothetical protein
MQERGLIYKNLISAILWECDQFQNFMNQNFIDVELKEKLNSGNAW